MDKRRVQEEKEERKMIGIVQLNRQKIEGTGEGRWNFCQLEVKRAGRVKKQEKGVEETQA